MTTLDVSRRAIAPLTAGVAYGEGAVWAVFDDSTLARIEPGSRRLSSTVAGLRPTALVAADGWLWVASSADSSVLRFDPETFARGPIDATSVGRRPSAIAYGADSVWATAHGDGVVSRIDPGTRSVLQIRVGEAPAAVAAAASAVWVANSGDGTVSRIDPSTNEVVETIHVGNAPTGIAAAKGLVWVTVQSR